MNYFSMFSGIGGFEKGIEQAYGIQRQQSMQKDCAYIAISGDDRWTSSGDGAASPTCIGFSEIDQRAIEIYRYHYPEHQNYGDATGIIPDELPDFDLLVGGFPCQAFSIAGKRGGFNDTRGTLFFEIARILETKRPRNFLLENVKGLFSHDSGNTFKTIIRNLNDIGYCVEWDCLNSKNYGVPQNRERVFIVGYFGGLPGREIFPLGDYDGTADVIQRQPTNCLTARYFGAQSTGTYVVERELNAQNEMIQVGTFRTHKEGQGFRKVESGNCRTIPARARNDGSGQPVIMQLNPSLESGGKQPYQQNRIYDENGIIPAHQGELSSGAYAIQNQSRIRRLTPLECERLQGFPAFWTRYGINQKDEVAEMSDTSRYKALGNAVTVNVIEAIIRKMIQVGRFK